MLEQLGPRSTHFQGPDGQVLPIDNGRVAVSEEIARGLLSWPGAWRRSVYTKTEKLARAGLKRAGLLVEGVDHLCRRCKGRGTP